MSFPRRITPIPSPFSVDFWHHPVALLLQHSDHILALGGSAVIVFFVLSGFVLTVSLEQPNETYGRFVIKRFLRIYPPFAFAIFVSLGLYWLIRPMPVAGLTEWFNNGTWHGNPDAHLLKVHFLMSGPAADETLDNVMWSLAHELRISVIFPLIVFCVLRWFRTSVFLSLTVSCLALASESNSALGDWILTLHYAVFFFTGVALAVRRNKVKMWLFTQPKAVRLVLWLTAFGCLFMPPEYLRGGMVYVVGAGANLIVMLCFCEARAVAFMENRVPLYLGRISYSLYLIHIPVMAAILHLLYGRIPVVTLTSFGMAATIVLADLMYRFVEQPSQKLGRILSQEAGPVPANNG